MASPGWMTNRCGGPEAAMASRGIDVNAAHSPWRIAACARDALMRGGAFALRLEQALLLDNPSGHVGEAQVALASSQLKSAECVLLGEIERRHQQPLRAFDELAILERLLRAVDLRL